MSGHAAIPATGRPRAPVDIHSRRGWPGAAGQGMNAGKRLRWRFQNLLWDSVLGISTRGIYGVKTPGIGRYMTLPYPTTFAILRRLSLTPRDTLLDIGCGKGRMICCASLFAPLRVIGIELSSALCAIAERNVARLRRRKAPIIVANALAQEFDYRGADVLYFYNSFGPPTLDAVLARIEESIRDEGRSIRFVYANPMHEQALKARSWLEQYDELHPDHDDRVAVRVSFWKSRVG